MVAIHDDVANVSKYASILRYFKKIVPAYLLQDTKGYNNIDFQIDMPGQKKTDGEASYQVNDLTVRWWILLFLYLMKMPVCTIFINLHF